MDIPKQQNSEMPTLIVAATLRLLFMWDMLEKFSYTMVFFYLQTVASEVPATINVGISLFCCLGMSIVINNSHNESRY